MQLQMGSTEYSTPLHSTVEERVMLPVRNMGIYRLLPRFLLVAAKAITSKSVNPPCIRVRDQSRPLINFLGGGSISRGGQSTLGGTCVALTTQHRMRFLAPGGQSAKF
jgi:hypothetical protein